jgi:CBS domain containing-hemolysin-like protein
VFSEIIPKSLGVHYAPAISRFAAPFIRFFTYALFPLVVFLEWLSKLMQRGQRHVGTEDQISALVKLGGSAGLIEKDEIQLINRVFTLNDSTAEQIMTPLKQICSLPSDMTVWEAAEIVVARRFSRFPVLGAGSGEIVGYVLARDILEAAYRGETDRRVCEVSAGIPEVELSDTSDDLLPLFRELKLHMAVVRKAGRTIGIVTLEDVLEELVGEIWDETDA